MKKLFILIVLTILIIFAGTLTKSVYKLYMHPKESMRKDISKRIDGYNVREICLGGHIYYKISSGIAPKLDHVGNPCKCK